MNANDKPQTRDYDDDGQNDEFMTTVRGDYTLVLLISAMDGRVNLGSCSSE